MNYNICKFSESQNRNSDIFAFQFVYETNPQRLEAKRLNYSFICHLVTEGSAEFTSGAGKRKLEKGDVFFTFPSEPFTIEPDGNCCYLYISFVGNYASDILKEMNITRENPVLTGFAELIEVWKSGIQKCDEANLSFMAKSMLYHAFALFSADSSGEGKSDYKINSVINAITEKIENNYSDPDLSLENISEELGYNPKYISRKFKEITETTFSNYLEVCRIRHASAMLAKNNKSVREIALSSGYRDPLYFSRVFKKIIKISPAKYREDLRKNNSEKELTNQE